MDQKLFNMYYVSIAQIKKKSSLDIPLETEHYNSYQSYM